MESVDYIKRDGNGWDVYRCIHLEIYKRLAESRQSGAYRRIYWETTKTLVVNVLIEHSRRGEPGLSDRGGGSAVHWF